MHTTHPHTQMYICLLPISFLSTYFSFHPFFMPHVTHFHESFYGHCLNIIISCKPSSGFSFWPEEHSFSDLQNPVEFLHVPLCTPYLSDLFYPTLALSLFLKHPRHLDISLSQSLFLKPLSPIYLQICFSLLGIGSNVTPAVRGCLTN